MGYWMYFWIGLTWYIHTRTLAHTHAHKCTNKHLLTTSSFDANDNTNSTHVLDETLFVLCCMRFVLYGVFLSHVVFYHQIPEICSRCALYNVSYTFNKDPWSKWHPKCLSIFFISLHTLCVPSSTQYPSRAPPQWWVDLDPVTPQLECRLGLVCSRWILRILDMFFASDFNLLMLTTCKSVINTNPSECMGMFVMFVTHGCNALWSH